MRFQSAPTSSFSCAGRSHQPSDARRIKERASSRRDRRYRTQPFGAQLRPGGRRELNPKARPPAGLEPATRGLGKPFAGFHRWPTFADRRVYQRDAPIVRHLSRAFAGSSSHDVAQATTRACGLVSEDGRARSATKHWRLDEPSSSADSGPRVCVRTFDHAPQVTGAHPSNPARSSLEAARRGARVGQPRTTISHWWLAVGSDRPAVTVPQWVMRILMG